MRGSFFVFVALLLAPGPAPAGDSYLIERDGGTGVEPTVAELEYSERFAVMSVALSADGREAAATNRTSPDGVRAWRLKDGRGGRLPKVSGVPVRVAYANGSPRIAVAIAPDTVQGREGMIELSDLSTGRPGPSLRGAEDVRAIAFSPDDEIVLAALPEGVRAWDLREGSSRDLLRLRGGADTVSFSTATEAYVSAEGGAMIYRVRVPDGAILEQWKGKRAGGPIAISPGGRYLAAATDDGRIKLHDLDAGGSPRKLEVGDHVTAVSWAAGGRLLAVGTKGGMVKVYDADGDSLPTGFSDTPRLEGRGGGVVGGWDGARRDEPEDREDTSFDRNDEGNLRLDLDMGRDTSSPRGGGGGLPGPGRSVDSGPVEIKMTPKVLVLDQMGGDPREGRDLEASVVKNEKRLKRCWRKAQNAGEPVQGKIVFEMGVTPEGEGVAIGAPVEDGVGSPKLVECLQGRLREALFGPGLGSMDIRLELVLDAAR